MIRNISTIDAIGSEPAPRNIFPGKRAFFKASHGDWIRTVSFMLSASLLGLRFYPAILLIAVLMVDSWRRDRYHFMLQLLIISGTFALVEDVMLQFKRYDLILAAGVAGLFVIRKSTVEIRRSIMAFLLYFAAIIAIAWTSSEQIHIQMKIGRRFFIFVGFTVPIMIFTKRKFDPMRFFTILATYLLTMSVFYILDAFVIQGWLFVPASFSSRDPSTFYSPDIKPFSGYLPRKYPPGMYLTFLAIYPLLKFYRFNKWQWTLLILALAATKTISVIAAVLFTYLLFLGLGKRFVYGLIVAVIAVTALYHIDDATGGKMRIASTIDQFTILENAEDIEDLAEFGTSRAAQIIPKMMLLHEHGRQWLGFGFIHPEESKNTAFQLTNDLYSDVEKSDENAAAVEEVHFQTILFVGYLGLIIQTIFYFGLYFIVRRMPLAKYYLSVLVACEIAGIGGFANITDQTGLLPLAWAFAVVLMTPGPRRKEETEEKNRKKRRRRKKFLLSFG
ncbi:MAG: hypothetical protein NC336_01595 [Clostridium sp.]|nr:hypothetical protein [Clostridium sp.]